MIGRNSEQVFGIVPRDIKERILKVKQRNPQWSESKIIKAGLLRILPEIEGQPSPNHERPRRKK